MIITFIKQHFTSIVLMISAIVTAIGSSYDIKNKTKTFILITFLIISAIFSFYESKVTEDQNNRIESNTILAYELEKTNNQMTKNIELLSAQIRGISLESKKLTSENLIFAKTNSELSDKLLRLTSQINSFIKGKNSFCYLDTDPLSPTIGRFVYTGVGNNPLKNVRVNMLDFNTYPWNELDTVGKLTKTYEEYFTIMQLGNINPNLKSLLNKEKGEKSFHVVFVTKYIYNIDKQKVIKLNLEFTTDNDYWPEKLRMYYDTSINYWRSAIKVERQGKVLYKTSSLKNFPKKLLGDF